MNFPSLKTLTLLAVCVPCLGMLGCSSDKSGCETDFDCTAPSNPCQQAKCAAGSCTVANRDDKTTCSGGTCFKGDCCTGCVTDTACVPGTDVTACGVTGAACQSCDDAQECTQDQCQAGVCSNPYKPMEAKPCTGGYCHTGSCCLGCWDGAACVAGQTDALACGKNGYDCQTCNDQNPCTDDSCLNGGCAHTIINTPIPCTGGVCRKGDCCGGCWDDTTDQCKPGTEQTACGTQGAACESCTGACTQGACQ